MKTVAVDLWAGQLRGFAANQATCIAPSRALALPIDVRAYFIHAYPKVMDACRAVDEPGVALVAVDETTGHPAGIACLRARVDRHVSAILGRHDECDLFLTGNERLALRQLAVVLAPVRDWRADTSNVAFRILDLRTSEGMVDEGGRPLRALRSEGPAIVRCGGYVIYALPLGDPTDWPTSAADAWACLPERVYFDELARIPDATRVRNVAPAQSQNTSVVFRMPGPRDTAMPLVTNHDVAGRLQLRGPWGQATLEVGHQALREGVLVGRYARCDGHGLCVDESLSRVHALLLQVDDRVLVIDVASTNGTRLVGRQDARVIELIGDCDLELGHATRIRWCWSS
jgi:hypothetical protein